LVRYKKPVERSASIEDRRGSPGRRAAGIGLGGGGLAAIIAIIMALLGGGSGVDLGGVLDQLQPAPQAPAETVPLDPASDPDADLADYMSVVIDDVQLVWDDIFRSAGLQYQQTTVVLFTGFTESGCGGADSRMGPHYCPLDRKVYLDLDFFKELEARFGARGDLAPAYVLAHEVAHHVQNLLGINEKVRAQQQANPGEANQLSVRLELQADCFAGVWASSVFVDRTRSAEVVVPEGRAIEIDPGEIAEALEAAAAVGDDRIQSAATGRIDPESWTHGSSEQRQNWFNIGYESGDPNRCDTFAGNV
jgi:predicted metalloprotease